MDGGYFFIDNIRSPFVQPVDNTGNSFFIAGNELGRQDDGIVFLDFDMPVRSGGHPGQGRHGLSLTAGGDHHDVAVRIMAHLVDIDFHLFRNVQIFKISGNIGAGLDTAAVDDYFFASGPGQY